MSEGLKNIVKKEEVLVVVFFLIKRILNSFGFVGWS